MDGISLTVCALSTKKRFALPLGLLMGRAILKRRGAAIQCNARYTTISLSEVSMNKTYTIFIILLLFVVAVAGCGADKATEVTQTSTPTLHPTFTPTPTKDIGAPAPTQAPTQPPPTQQATPTEATPTSEPQTPTPEPTTPAPPTPTPTPNQPQVKITANLVNLRSGPGTNYPVASQAKKGQVFDILAKNQKGSWYQITANGKKVWVINDPKFTATIGDTGSITVATNIPKPPPTPKPRPTNTPAPTPTPAPSYPFKKYQFEERINSNAIVTFFGGLYNRDLTGPVRGYHLTVIAPNGERREAPFGDLQFGDPGLDSQFIYNAKIEFPLMPGNYRMFVTDGGGNPVSEEWTATVRDNIRTFLPQWQEK